MKRGYLAILGSAATRFTNALFGGNDYREPTSSAVGRKAAEGRRWAIIAEALINLPFALFGERDHCANAAEQYRTAMGIGAS